MSIWAKHVREKFQQVDDRYPDHVEPLLRGNVLCELLSAVPFLLLVRLWSASSARIQFGTVMNDRPFKFRTKFASLQFAQ